MEICKICGIPVEAGPTMHGDCLEQLVTEVTEQFCDNYCRWPLTNAELWTNTVSTPDGPDTESSEAMNAVLKYPGAKWSLAEWIIGHFPTHHHRRREEVLWMNFEPEQRQEALWE